MKRILALAAIILLASDPAIACAGKIVKSTAPTSLVYSPFAASDAKQTITIRVQNTGNDSCAYQLSIPDRYRPLLFAANLQFSIIAKSIEDNRSFNTFSTPIVRPGKYFDFKIALIIYRGQSTTSGMKTKAIGFILTTSTQRAPIDEVQLTLKCMTPQIFEINLAGSGMQTTLQFNELRPGSTRSVVMQTRATQSYRLEIQATNGYLVHEGSWFGDLSMIPYVLAVDGQTYSLATGNVVVIKGPPGDGSHLLTIKIGDTRNKMAGVYKTVISIRISSL
jgi:hypothetical protein